jgi:hypothetical protein
MFIEIKTYSAAANFGDRPVLFPLTITVTEMSVNENTSIPLIVTEIETEIHAKTEIKR